MKILEINKYLYLRRGAEKHLLDVAALLKEAGHDVRFFGMQHPENISDIPKENLPSYVGYNQHDSSLGERLKGIGRIFWSFEAEEKLEKLLLSWCPSVAHIHNIYHQLSFSVLKTLKRHGIRTVMTVHDFACVSPDKDAFYSFIGKSYWKFLFYQKYSFPKRMLLVLRSYWELCLGGYEKYVDVFVVPSNFVRERLLLAGIRAEKIVVLPHFISIEKKQVQREEQGFLLSLTGASLEKNTHLLEEICQDLSIPLVICGVMEEGYVRSSSPYVTYAGKKTQEEIREYLKGARAGVSSSQLPETFGLVALETIAHGRPFFCFDTGAYKEIIRDGIDGRVVKTPEELREALQNFWSENEQFDEDKIQESAYERFGRDKYLQVLEKIFENK